VVGSRNRLREALISLLIGASEGAAASRLSSRTVQYTIEVTFNMNITNARVPGFFNSRFHIDIPNDHDIGPIEGRAIHDLVHCAVYLAGFDVPLHNALSGERAQTPSQR
jgi:hypothetical protein